MRIVPARSHSDRHRPGCVGRTVVVVVVLVVVVVVVDVDEDFWPATEPSSSEMSIDSAFCWASSRSMENGVVAGDGQPVNSVVVLC